MNEMLTEPNVPIITVVATTSIMSQPWMKPILAGALTGAIESFITYPTEYIKTHLQLQDRRNPMYSGIIDCYRKTVNEHGALGLYRGLAPILAGSIPKQATRWGAYEGCVSFLQNRKRAGKHTPTSPPLNLFEISCCGFFAGCVEALCAVVPTETVKTKLIDDAKSAAPKYHNKNLFSAVSAMVRAEGFRGAYAGVSNTVTKQGLNQSIRFPAQLTAMTFIAGNGDPNHRAKSPLWNGVAGFCAGIVSVAVTQPFDVIKTKMQGVEAKEYKSSWDCWKTTARYNGVMHFYSGSLARSMRVGGNVALTFTIFPLIKNWL